MALKIERFQPEGERPHLLRNEFEPSVPRCARAADTAAHGLTTSDPGSEWRLLGTAARQLDRFADGGSCSDDRCAGRSAPTRINLRDRCVSSAELNVRFHSASGKSQANFPTALAMPNRSHLRAHLHRYSVVLEDLLRVAKATAFALHDEIPKGVRGSIDQTRSLWVAA